MAHNAVAIKSPAVREPLIAQAGLPSEVRAHLPNALDDWAPRLDTRVSVSEFTLASLGSLQSLPFGTARKPVALVEPGASSGSTLPTRPEEGQMYPRRK